MMRRITQCGELSRRAWRKFAYSAALLVFPSRRSHSSTGPKAPVCENVKQWAASRPGSVCRMLFESRSIARKPPQTIEPQIHSQYSERLTADQTERYLARISGARIQGDNGLVILPDGSYASESVYGRSVLERDPDYCGPRPRPVIEKAGNYFSLLVIWSKGGNYYHWLHDTLQRLYRVTEWLPEDVIYIVPPNLQPFQMETLRLVGIRDDQLDFFEGDEVWELENLYFSPPTTNSGSHRREADEWLRDKILQGYQIAPAAPRRRIFVSRRGMTNRRLVNEAAVARFLQQYGFETCRPETLSFRSQVELFAQAEVVVSTHGSAFANILFAPSGLVVVDMIQPRMLDWAYVFWAMSEELGHSYWYFLAEEQRHGKRTDTYVPMEKLAATFDRMQLQ